MAASDKGGGSEDLDFSCVSLTSSDVRCTQTYAAEASREEGECNAGGAKCVEAAAELALAQLRQTTARELERLAEERDRLVEERDGARAERDCARADAEREHVSGLEAAREQEVRWKEREQAHILKSPNYRGVVW